MKKKPQTKKFPAHPSKKQTSGRSKSTAPAAKQGALARTTKRVSSFLETDTSVKALAVQMDRATEVAFDTETSGLNPRKDVMVGMSVADDTDAGFFFLPNKNTVAASTMMVTRPNGALIGHNVKFDLHFMAGFGIRATAAFIHDTMVLARLLDENRMFIKGNKDKPYGLKPLARDWFDKSSTESSDAMQEWMAKNNKTMSDIKDVPKALLAKYGAEDARITLGLYRTIRKRLAEDGIPDSVVEREAHINRIAYEMEARGILINVPVIKKLKVQLEKQKVILHKKLQKIAGYPFNPDSQDQLLKVLVKLGFKPKEEDASAKTGKDSVDEEAIKRFKHPITPVLLEYRSLMKNLGTFVNGMLERQVKGVIHCDFDTSGARTGRWSCRNPNLQNQPPEARFAFVPRKGFDIWSFDYKQIEPTLLAHFSDDYELKQLFVDGGDFHTMNAAAAFGVPPEKVTKEQRDKAKVLGLAVLYGAGVDKTAGMMGIDRDEAKQLLSNYHTRFPAVKALNRSISDEIEATAREAAVAAGRLYHDGEDWQYKVTKDKVIKLPQHKFVTKRPGLKPIPLGQAPKEFAYEDRWKDPDYWMFDDWSVIQERGFLQNPFGYKRRLTIGEAYKGPNSKIQGTAAALIKEAMVRVDREVVLVFKGKAFPLIQVHDELVMEIIKGPVGRRIAMEVKAAMESLGEDFIKDVPIRVDVAMSPKSWGDIKDVKL